jgi:threonine dehydratase
VRYYALEAKLVVEPTGALTLAAYRRLLAGPVDGIALQDGPTALLISGGNIAPAMLSALLSAKR